MPAIIDETEPVRKQMLQEINAPLREKTPEEARAELEAQHGQVWDTSQLGEDFDVHGFAAPVVVVTRKKDRVKGSLLFSHHPRFYFGFQEYKGG